MSIIPSSCWKISLGQPVVTDRCTSIEIIDILVFGRFILVVLRLFAIAFLVRAFGCLYDYVDFICFRLGPLLGAAPGFLGFSPWLTGFNLVCVRLVDLWVGDGPVLASVKVFVEKVWRTSLTSAIFSVVHHEIELLLIHAVVWITTHILIRMLWITWKHSFAILNIWIISRIISIPYHIWTLALIIGELTILLIKLKTISSRLIHISTLVKRGVSVVAVIKSLVQDFVGHLDNSSIALFVQQWAVIHQWTSVV